MKFTTLPTVIVLVCLSAICGCTGRGDSAAESRGRSLFEARDFQGSITVWDQVLSASPHNVNALIFRARAHLAVQKFDQAITDAEAALKLDDKNNEALCCRCQARIAKEVEASCVIEVVDVEPVKVDDPVGLSGSIPSLLPALRPTDDNVFERALADFNSVLERDPKCVSALVGRSQVYLWCSSLNQGGDFGGSIGSCPAEPTPPADELEKSPPTTEPNPTVPFSQPISLSQDLKRALADCDQALLLEPNNPDVLLLERQIVAAGELRWTKELNDDSWTKCGRILQEPRELRRHYVAINAAHPADDRLIPLLERIAELQEAVADFPAALVTRNELRVRLSQTFGEQDWRLASHDAEVKDLRRLGQLTFSQLRRWIQLRRLGSNGIVAVRRQRLELAQELLGKDSKLYADSLAELAAGQLQSRDCHAALEINRQCLERTKQLVGESHPLVGDILLRMADCEQRLGNTEEELQLRRNGISLLPKDDSGPASYTQEIATLAARLESLRQDSEAAQLFQQLVTINRQRKVVLGYLRDYLPDFCRVASFAVDGGHDEWLNPLVAALEQQLTSAEKQGKEQAEYYLALTKLAKYYDKLQTCTQLTTSPDQRQSIADKLTSVREKLADWIQRIRRPQLVRRLGHSDAVAALEFSSNGKWMVSLDRTGQAIVWDTASGLELKKVAARQIAGVRFTADSRYLLTFDYPTATLWELDTGLPVQSYQFNHAIWFVETLLDETELLVSDDQKRIRVRDQVYDLTTGRKIFRLDSIVGSSPCLQQVVTQAHDAGEIVVWDVLTHKQLSRCDCNGPAARTNNLGFSNLLTYSFDVSFAVGELSREKGYGIYELATGKQLRKLSRATRFSTDGRWLVDLDELAGTVTVFEPQTNRKVGTVQFCESTSAASDEHNFGEWTSYVVSPTGRFVLVWSSRQGKLFDLNSGKQLFTLIDSRDEGTFRFTQFSAKFSPDEKTLVIGDLDEGIKTWRIEGGVPLQQFVSDGFESGPWSTVATSNTVPIVSYNQELCVWDTSQRELRHKLVLEGRGQLRVHDQNVITGAGVWKLTSPPTFRAFEFKDHLRSFYDVEAISANGEYAALTYAADLTIDLMQITTGKLCSKIEVPNSFMDVAISCDGRFVTTSGFKDDELLLWDTKAGTSISLKNKSVSGVSFTRDGRWLLIPDSDYGERKFNFYSIEEVIKRNSLPQKSDFSLSGMSYAICPKGKHIGVARTDKIEVWSIELQQKICECDASDSYCDGLIFSPDGNKIAGNFGAISLWDVATGRLFSRFGGNDGLSTPAFSHDGRFLFARRHGQEIVAYEVTTGKELCRLAEFSDGSWAVIDPEGRYEASNGGDIEALHWVVGMNSISLKQLKERYYELGLLAKLLRKSNQPLRKVEAFRDVKLFPDAKLDIAAESNRLNISLANRGGGIGRVQVFINGKELAADARGSQVAPEAQSATLEIDLPTNHLLPGKPNRVEVVTWNADGYLCSRGLVREFQGPTETAEPPQLYAVVAGVSQYENSALNLRFAAKDAEDFATALELGSKRLFGVEKSHVHLLATSDHPRAIKPTKENFNKVFTELRKAKPGDILVVYLAGHGVALQQGNDLYCYLTADARSLDPQSLNDPALRSATTITSDELAEWTKLIPALKQVMVLDTCAAGAAAVKLTEKRDIAGDQIRAIERLKDRTGFHVLMGCSADRVSYEASQYGQGLLTYALLKGMRGASLRDDQFVDVSKLFQYAADQVPELAQNIGGVQRPVVAAPRGTSFDVGRLDADDRAKVPLSLVKPLILKPALLNRDEDEDDLKLTILLRQRLVETSQPSVRGKDPVIVYIPEDDFPGAVRPTGTYSVEGDTIAVRITLKRDGTVLARLQLEGDKSNLPALADKIAKEVLTTVQ